MNEQYGGDPLFEAADKAAQRGWSVIPAHTPGTAGECSCRRAACPNPGKHPRGNWSEHQRRRATRSEIARWWGKRWPGTSLGIATGQISNVVVLDVDPDSGGQDSLEELVQRFGPLPDTVVALSGGGGTHYYFKHPGYEMKSGTAFMPGLDIRADGGFVVIPPSIHSSGRSYEWEASSEPDAVAMAPLSEHVTWLSKQRITTVAEPVTAAFDLAGAMSTPIPKGERNTRLVQIAGSLFGSGNTGDYVRETLLRLNQSLCQPPMDETEVQSIVASVGKLEAEKAQAGEAVARLVAGNSAADNFSETDRLAMACSMWAEIGLDAVADWVYLRGGVSEYVIETAENEIRLGPDLLNYVAIRRSILNQGLELIEPHSAKLWAPKALVLRKLAREVSVDPTRAEDQLAVWLRDFLDSKDAHNDTGDINERLAALRTGALRIEGRLHLRPALLAQHLKIVGGDNIQTSYVRKIMTQAGWDTVAVATKAEAKGRSTTTSCWREPADDD